MANIEDVMYNHPFSPTLSPIRLQGLHISVSPPSSSPLVYRSFIVNEWNTKRVFRTAWRLQWHISFLKKKKAIMMYEFKPTRLREVISVLLHYYLSSSAANFLWKAFFDPLKTRSFILTALKTLASNCYASIQCYKLISVKQTRQAP